MHSLFTALAFVAMVLTPCLVALNTGMHSLEEEPEEPASSQP